MDRLDQNVNHLRICIKRKKWHYCVVTWLLGKAVQNALQLHQKSVGILSTQNFRREIIRVILRASAEVHIWTPSGGQILLSSSRTSTGLPLLGM
jgi:hypothetical protein